MVHNKADQSVSRDRSAKNEAYRGGGHSNQRNTGERLTLPLAGAFGENTSLKKWGVIGWEAKFWFKIRGRWGYVTFDLSVSTLKVGICKWENKSSKMAKMISVDEIETKSSFLWQPNAKRVFGWERLKNPHFTKNCGVFGWQQRQSAKIWGHWVTAALKIGGLWSLTSASPP